MKQPDLVVKFMHKQGEKNVECIFSLYFRDIKKGTKEKSLICKLFWTSAFLNKEK